MLQLPMIITDFDIQALVDNELSWQEEKRIMEHILKSSILKKRFEKLQRQKKLLQRWYVSNIH